MWLFVPVLLLALLHYLVAIRNYGLLTPDGLFVVAQLLMTYGTVRLVDEDSVPEVRYAHLMLWAVTVYLVVSLATFLGLTRRWGTARRRVGPARPYQVRLVPPTGSVVVGTVVALGVTAIYFVAVGYSAFVVGLQGLLSGEQQDVSTLRLESYAGETYLFPGYANQFRNVFLPSLAVVLALWFFSRPSLAGRVFALFPLGLAVLGLVGTGQRGAFFLFLLTMVVYAFLAAGHAMSRWMLLVPLLGTPMVLLATQVLGRSAGAAGHPLQALLSELYRRFFEDNQLSGIAAFNYTAQLPVQNGAEWFRSLRGLLPGDRGSTLANEVFATLYGSRMGTSPPSLWGSIHHNFGSFGVIVAAVLLGFALQMLTFHAVRGRRYNSLQLIGYAGITVVLGTWVAGGPDTPLNCGLLAYAVLWYWGRRLERAERAVPVAPDGSAPPNRGGSGRPPPRPVNRPQPGPARLAAGRW